MRRMRIAASTALALLAPGWALAHHAEAPHFLTDRTAQIEGTVLDWSPQNPHSVLDVTVKDATGANPWRCEANGIAQIQRAGVAKGTFKPGDKVTLIVHPGRHDPHLCEMVEARTPDGKAYVFRPSTPAAGPSPAVARRNNSIYGVWEGDPATLRRTLARITPANGGQSSQNLMLDKLTPAGRKATLAYDALRDDPARHCSPIAPQRLWGAVDSNFDIQRHGATIVLHHEFMDAVRTIHLDQADHAKAGPRSLLGHSIGRFEGDTLVVDTTNYTPGVTVQYALDAAGKLRGVLHSEAYHTVERIRFDPATHGLEVTWTQEDPKYFSAPFPEERRSFVASPRDGVPPFNCKPDVEIGRREARG